MTNPLAVDEIRGCPNKHGRGASSCCGLRFAAERVNTNVVRTFQSGVFMPSIFVSPYVLPIMLLFASNLFMTIAWYGHLRFKEVPLFGVIVVSWLIAFVEYCAAVPANRWGSAVYTTAQLKTIQEVITLLIFAGFSIVYLKEPLTWNYAIGFVLIASGAFFVFRGPL
jgi:uncharacterized protein